MDKNLFDYFLENNTWVSKCIEYNDTNRDKSIIRVKDLKETIENEFILGLRKISGIDINLFNILFNDENELEWKEIKKNERKLCKIIGKNC